MGRQSGRRFSGRNRAESPSQETALEYRFLSRAAGCGEVSKSSLGGIGAGGSKNSRSGTPAQFGRGGRAALVGLPFRVEPSCQLCGADALSWELRHKSGHKACNAALSPISKGGAAGFWAQVVAGSPTRQPRLIVGQL